MSKAFDRRQHGSRTKPAGGASGANAGYTLLELLITLLVIALLSTLVGPSFINTINRNRQQAALGDVHAMLSAARGEAVALQQLVSVCPSTDQDVCAGTAWEAGWIMFVDDGTGGAASDVGDGDRINGATGETLLRVGQPVGGDVTVRTRNFPDAGAVTFTQEGLAVSRGTFVLCNGDPAQASALVVNISGQVRMGVDEDADGQIDEDDGTQIDTCP